MITNKDKRYCSRCGVEVELGVKECPLCQTPIPKLSDEPPIFTKKYPDKPAKFDRSPRRTPKQKRILAWEIVSASLLLPLIITLLTNIIINQTVSWALYPLISIVLAWLLTTIPLLFPDKPSIIIAGEVTSIMLFLLLLDLIPDLEVDWYLRLALPILALIGIITTAVVIGSVKAKRKGLNLPAFILFGIGGICIGLDMIVMSYINSRLTIGWSLFVITPCVIIGVFFLYLHYRLAKKVDIKRKIQL